MSVPIRRYGKSYSGRIIWMGVCKTKVMRMWMVNPQWMCRKHLLGEHYELHMIVGWINRRKSIQGFIDKNLIFPEQIVHRHSDLAFEMSYHRKYNHNSPILYPKFYIQQAPVLYLEGIKEDIKNELIARCKECAMLHKLYLSTK